MYFEVCAIGITRPAVASQISFRVLLLHKKTDIIDNVVALFNRYIKCKLLQNDSDRIAGKSE